MALWLAPWGRNTKLGSPCQNHVVGIRGMEYSSTKERQRAIPGEVGKEWCRQKNDCASCLIGEHLAVERERPGGQGSGVPSMGLAAGVWWEAGY